MTAFNQVSIGFRSYGKALEIIFSRGLWWYFAIPFFLDLFLFLIGFSYAVSVVKPVQQWFLEASGLETADFFLSEFIRGFFLVFIIILIKIFFFLVFAMAGGYLTLIILSPFLALLSERTEQILTGKNYSFDSEQFMRDVIRGILITFRNFIYQLTFTILLFLAGFIPLAGWLSPVVMFFVSSYFYGYSFLDYSLERKRFSVSQSSGFINKNKWLSISNGSIFSLVILIPFAGPLLAGFIAIISTVAAAVSAEEALPDQTYS